MSDDAKPTTMVRMDSLRVGDIVLNNDVIVTVVKVYPQIVNGTMAVYIQKGDEYGENIHDRPETMVELVKRADVRCEEAKPTHTPEPWECERGWNGMKDILFVSTKWNDGFRPWTDADAKRIVACVNACAGIADPFAVPELIAAAEQALAYIASDGRDVIEEDLLKSALAKIKGGTK